MTESRKNIALEFDFSFSDAPSSGRNTALSVSLEDFSESEADSETDSEAAEESEATSVFFFAWQIELEMLYSSKLMMNVLAPHFVYNLYFYETVSQMSLKNGHLKRKCRWTQIIA
jgi:hypothetical protein